MTTENTIPTTPYEDLLFVRRLQRSLNNELGRFNALLKEQIALIEQHRKLMNGLSAGAAESTAAAEASASDQFVQAG